MSNKAKKTSNRLTVLFVNSNKLAPGLYGDGNNLFLSVRPSGSRSWVFRFRERGGNPDDPKRRRPLFERERQRF